MFAALAEDAGVNELVHHREPASVYDQRVIRQNRDTLYSSAIIHISQGATLSIPDAGDRYLSVMVVNDDDYINDVLHPAGEHPLTVDKFDTDYVAVAARILVDPNDAADLDAVHALQDQLSLHAESARPFVMPEYDEASFDATRQALLTLARGLAEFDHAFGPKRAVDPIRHLLGTAAGWGGLPSEEAVVPRRRARTATRRVQGHGTGCARRRVLVDLRVQPHGFFEPNDRNAYSVYGLRTPPTAPSACYCRSTHSSSSQR